MEIGGIMEEGGITEIGGTMEESRKFYPLLKK